RLNQFLAGAADITDLDSRTLRHLALNFNVPVLSVGIDVVVEIHRELSIGRWNCEWRGCRSSGRQRNRQLHGRKTCVRRRIIVLTRAVGDEVNTGNGVDVGVDVDEVSQSTFKTDAVSRSHDRFAGAEPGQGPGIPYGRAETVPVVTLQ